MMACAHYHGGILTARHLLDTRLSSVAVRLWSVASLIRRKAAFVHLGPAHANGASGEHS